MHRNFKKCPFNEETLLIRRGCVLTCPYVVAIIGENGTSNVHKIYKLHNLGHNFY